MSKNSKIFGRDFPFEINDKKTKLKRKEIGNGIATI